VDGEVGGIERERRGKKKEGVKEKREDRGDEAERIYMRCRGGGPAV